MSPHNSQLLDSHGSSPISYTPEDSGSDDTGNSDAQSRAVLNTLSQLRAQNAELQDKNTELRIQNAQLQAEVGKHVAISKVREQFVQPVIQDKQNKQECRCHFWIICALIFFTR
ncbi:hypothetical protein BHYA_0056g00350 [Botrytis hyacinthi]|uniref:Uncharacterized protein n=1 Tax=Botrytis hyacinthi TaxID=278943 RepID=A0A4Z1GQW2_9HELO|nr:hypothetical protein BHYA_0056g00350 [Botrytis hyacinthi]